ncbi:glycosyl hydrolase family 17 protein [Myxococcota bacterium]|nr:glycosyl hydrolase family 17 protein [Myxococcota bacterium]
MSVLSARPRLALIALIASATGCAAPVRALAPQPSFTARPISFVDGGRWIGNGIAYGPYRDGQRPGGPAPSLDELREDVRILTPRWRVWRTYGADAVTEALLGVIHTDAPGVKLVLGAWIEPETSTTARANNRAQVDTAIRLARAHRDNVLAINVGNETQVSWSGHRVDRDVLVGYLREVRAATTVPVTTADDFSWWLSPDADPVAQEIDFVMVHAYAMWNGRSLEDAVAFTEEKYSEVAARFPGRTIVLGELGWATQRHDEGEQAKLVRGVAGEEEQRRFFEDFVAWATAHRVPNLYFEAFDENWKGGPHPNEIEKHWGLFRADRTPKRAITARTTAGADPRSDRTGTTSPR